MMWLCCVSSRFDPDITTVVKEKKEKEDSFNKGKEEGENTKEIKEKEEVLIYLDKYGKVRDVFINLNGMFVMVDNPEENIVSKEVLKQWFEEGSPKDMLYETLLSIKISENIDNSSNFKRSSFRNSKHLSNKNSLNKNLNVKKILKLEHQIKKELNSVTFSFDVLRNSYYPTTYKIN